MNIATKILLATVLAAFMAAPATAQKRKMKLAPPAYLTAAGAKKIDARCARIGRTAAQHQSLKRAQQTYRLCLIGSGWTWQEQQISFR